jgi:hypothetical protein
MVYSADKEPVDSKLKFDIADVLDAFLEYHFPTENQNITIFCIETSKHFFVVLREIYGIGEKTGKTSDFLGFSRALWLLFHAYFVGKI